MSVNQAIDASKMLGALELANPVTITSESGVLALTADSNCFIADGSEDINSIIGDSDVTEGIYIITWNTARTLTYSSSALLLIGQANRTTAIGDVGVYQLNGSVVTELLFQPVSGKVSSAAKADTATTAEACTGNAASATQLATARTISLTGDVTGSGTFDGSADLSITTTGVEAAKLTTARTISLTGAVTGSGTFDGSGDLSITTSGTVSTSTLYVTEQSLGTNGYRKWSDGMIEQWGYVSGGVADDSTVSVTFPVTFSTKVFYINNQYIESGATSYVASSCTLKSNYSLTGCTFIQDTYKANGTGLFWEAKGY